jgi:hypothetical protein
MAMYMYLPAEVFASYRIVPSPTWVLKVDFEKCKFSKDAISDGTCRLLSDVQQKADKKTHHSFFHYADEAMNQTGVEAESAVEIDFYPSFESLDLHFVRVWRGGRSIDRIVRENITELRRETGLETGMMDGAVTLHLIIDDIRPGDIVEYAFTVKGTNPIFKGSFFDMQWLAWTAPIQKLSIRLTTPWDFYLRYRTLLIDIPVRESLANNDMKEFKILREMIPTVIPEEDIPVWYTPVPSVQFSSDETWSDVVEWGRPLYKIPPKKSRLLEQEIDRIAAISQDPAERADAALTFVQDEVRYLGIEIGESTHLPSDPSKVMERRFGDCKDKALLLVTILSCLGIEAYPALVNLDLLEYVDQMLPSAAAFNHVIVAIKLKEKLFFVDPTQRSSPGSLLTLIPPDYGKVLILKEGENALSTLPRRTVSAPIKLINERFDLSGGPRKPVDLIVTSIYLDEEADILRALIEQQSLRDLEDAFKKAFQTDYPKLESASPISIDAALDKNQITVTEKYRIRDFWSARDLKTFEGRIFPRELHDLIATPQDRDRKMPLAVDYPIFIEQTTDVVLPSNVLVQQTAIEKSDDAFSYHYNVRRQKSGCRISIGYQTKKDHVPAEHAADHQRKRDDISRRMGVSFQIAPIRPVAEVPVDASAILKNYYFWLMIAATVLAAFVAILAVKLVRRHLRYRRSPQG